MLRRALAFASALAALLGAPAFAQQNADWRRPYPAFKLIGNVYWVGTYDLSTYLVTTGDGHILINTGFPETVPLIKEGVEKLGFRFADVKVLLATHAHGDHVAGLAELKRLTGARLMMMEPDAPLLEDGGRSDFRFGDEPGTRFAPVTVDRRLRDRDTIALGGVTLTAHHHPGHTKGATSFTLTVRENSRDYRVVIANMGSINPGVTVRGMARYPTIGDDYARTFAAQKALPVDVFLASHAAQFRMHEKYKPGDAYDPNRFVDPAGYRAAVDRLEKIYVEQLAKEGSDGSALAPTGTLRVAFLGSNPVHGRVNPGSGTITGPVADLVSELAKRRGVSFKLIPAPDVRAVIAAVNSGEADAGVMAYEAARAREVDFAGGFAVMFNSYVVPIGSQLKAVADADRPGIKIGAVRGQTQEIFLTANLKQAKLQIFEALPPPDELRRILARGDLDAFAMNQQRIEDAVLGSGGALRALTGSYVDVEQSFVVKKGEAGRAAELKAFVDEARASGLTKSALDRAQLVGVAVAGPR
jgi:metallo-beta-lactamase class B